jgi:hypothetical protein
MADPSSNAKMKLQQEAAVVLSKANDHGSLALKGIGMQPETEKQQMAKSIRRVIKSATDTMRNLHLMTTVAPNST